MTSPPIQPTLQNPARPDLRSLLQALNNEIRKQVNCARVGVIQSFDAANQTAIVQIAQQQVTSVSPNGVETLAQFPPLISVPVFILGGGGLSATFPIAAGDECLVVFNDREIDNWLLQGGTKSSPTTQRIHDLADGMCFVGFRSYPRSLAGYSTNSAQIRSDDGATVLDIAPGKIQLVADEVVIHGRNKTTFDAGGTGFVYTPSLITTYTDGVPSNHNPPDPPGPLP